MMTVRKMKAVDIRELITKPDCPQRVITEAVHSTINIGEFRTVFHTLELLNKIENISKWVNFARNHNHINAMYIVEMLAI